MLPAALLGHRHTHAAASPQRVVVEGHGFDARIAVTDTELVLNGTGVRAVAWFKGYAAALYLPQRTTDPAAVQALPGPKRLRMVMLQDVPAVEFSKAFVKGVSRNTEPEPLERLRPRMQQFVQWIDEGRQVRKGDIVDLDYTPAQGTQLLVNGRRQGGVLPGDDFYAALLRAFVGQRPFDVRLKAGLLGQG
jgi:hypothetical protein